MPYALPNSSLAAATTRSGSKPNFLWSSLGGAEPPKVFIPITWPEVPTYRSHLKVEACSTATRAFTLGGSTLLGLVVEDVPGRHRHHSRADALGEQCLVRIHGETDFTPRGDQHHFGVAAGSVRQHVGAVRHTRRRCVPASVQGRQGLARQRQRGPHRSRESWSMAPDRPSLRGTREYSARARSALCPRLLAPPCPSSRQETQVSCDATRPGVRVAASGRSGPRVRGRYPCKHRRALSIPGGPLRRVRRSPRRSAHRRQERGTSRSRAIRNCACQRAGVPRLDLLDRVNRKRANGIDTQLIDFHACHWLSNLRRGLRPSRSGAPPSAGLYRSTSCAVWFRPHAGRYPPRLYSAASFPTAARSASSRACSRRTRPAGIDTSASRKRRSISTFSLPVTTQSTRRARLSIG